MVTSVDSSDLCQFSAAAQMKELQPSLEIQEVFLKQIGNFPIC